MSYKNYNQERLHIRLRDVSVRNAQFDPVQFPISRSARFNDGTTVTFQLKSSNNPRNAKEYAESIIWQTADGQECVQTEQPNQPHRCFWNWLHDGTNYEIVVEILPIVCDSLPDGFHAKLTTSHMKTRFYIRDNDGYGYLKYQAPDMLQDYPVAFDDMPFAYMYLEQVVENPNLYSVVNFIESHPVQKAWLIQKA